MARRVPNADRCTEEPSRRTGPPSDLGGGVALSVFLIGILLALFRGWDEKVGEYVEDVPADLWEMNKAVVIASHDHRIRDFADRVFWLEDGVLRPES